MENATDVISFKAQKNYALNGKIMLCSVIILFVALFLILSLHGHACWFFDCYRRRRPSHLPSLSSAASNSSSGLDAVVISSIPTFVYSADRHKPPLVCAVCISEFEKAEAVRVLPKCNHTFHVDCIDMWFYSHSNCPLCRASVQSVITPETSS